MFYYTENKKRKERQEMVFDIMFFVFIFGVIMFTGLQ